MPRARMFLVLAVATLVLGACSGDERRSTTTTSVSTTSTSAASSVTTDASESSGTTASSPAAAGTVGEQGIGKLRLGMSVAEASATDEIGPTGPGCELAGDEELGAQLKSGKAFGVVTFRDGVLFSITVRSGAQTAAGVGPGSTIAQIQKAYASGHEVKVDESLQEQFGITLVSVLRQGVQRFQFDVGKETGKAASVSLPRINFCE